MAHGTGTIGRKTLLHYKVLNLNIGKRNYSNTEPFIPPKKVLILTKLSRYDFEKLRHPSLNETELEVALKKRGSDYRTLLYHCYIHKGCESRINEQFQRHGVETRVVNRFEYTQENIDWANWIVTTGGDGTFLLGACRIQDKNKPIIGFNTDPTRSEGYLCLPKTYSVNINDAVKQLFEGKFQWTFRKRIRVSLVGENVFQHPLELHDQQLQYPEYRFFDCLQERHHSITNDDTTSENSHKRILPGLALNEVYMGECVSARPSYFEISLNNSERIKSKNAGVCITTGTGSTSWAYNISKISKQTVGEIYEILKKNDTNIVLTKEKIERVTKLYNNKLIFEPESNKMLYVIRDPISSYTLPYALELSPRGYVEKIELRSRCFDCCLVIDGGLSFPFNDGTVAILEMYDSDSLRTVRDFDKSVGT